MRVLLDSHTLIWAADERDSACGDSGRKNRKRFRSSTTGKRWEDSRIRGLTPPARRGFANRRVG
jgi:hypothetical protein